MKGRSSKLCFVLCIGVFSLQGVSAVHLVKLSADLQRCPVLRFRDVEPHKQAAARAEKEKYEEAEALQMLLLRDFVFSKKREKERERAHCLSVLLCVLLFNLLSSGSPLGWGRPSPPRTGSSSSVCRPPCIQPICKTGLIFLQESKWWLQLFTNIMGEV